MEVQDAEQVIKVTRVLVNRRLVKNPIMEAKQVVTDLNPNENQAISLLTGTRV
jgi:hypothetical protein